MPDLFEAKQLLTVQLSRCGGIGIHDGFKIRRTPQQKVKVCASVVKLVDTPDSKSGSREGVSVRVRPLVPNA